MKEKMKEKMKDYFRVGDIVGIYNRTNPSVVTKIQSSLLFGNTAVLLKIVTQDKTTGSWILSDQAYKL